MRVLSVDCWGNKKDGFEWNSWYNVGLIEKTNFETLKTDKQIAVWFQENGFTTTSDMRQITIIDDGYNVCICEKKSGTTLFAIEYGPEY